MGIGCFSHPIPIVDSPPTLNSQCIRAFLEHRMILAAEVHLNTLDFMKSLLISKTVLVVSQRYNIYSLCVYNVLTYADYVNGKQNTWQLVFKKALDSSNYADIQKFDQAYVNSAPLYSYEQAFKVISLLEPEHLCLAIQNVSISNEFLDQCESMVNLVDVGGKTGLIFLNGWQRNQDYLLRRLAPKLNVLICNTDALLNCDYFSQLDLDHYEFMSYADESVLDSILRHRIKSIRINFVEKVAASGDSNQSASAECEWLEHLNLKYIGQKDSLRPFVDSLTLRCQKLKSLHIAFVDYNEYFSV